MKMPPLKALALFALVAVLCGCRVDQKKEVALYRKELDSKVTPTTEPALTDQPLTLDDAIKAANHSYEQLNERGEDYVQALVLKDRAVAGFLPTVSFQPSYTVEQRYRNNAVTDVGVSTTGGVSTPTSTVVPGASATTVGTGFTRLGNNALQQTQLPLVGSINLFRGFGDLNLLKEANLNIEYRKQVLLDAQASVTLDVAQVFYDVLRAEQQRDVVLNSIRLEEARVEDEQSKLKNGLSTNLALAQVVAQLDSTRNTLAQVEGDVINSRTMLGYLTDLPLDHQQLAGDVVVPEDRPPVDVFERLALEQRPDVLAARAEEQAARAAVDVAIAEYYPSVNLNIEGFLYREFYSDASKWNAILSANIPLFSAGLIEADVRTAWSRLRQAALNESDVRRSALRDVQQAYQNLLTAERSIRELQGELDAATESLKQAQSALANNLGIELDVLTAQDQVLNSQLQLTSARFDRSIYYLTLVRTTGQLPFKLPSQPLQPAATLPVPPQNTPIVPRATP